LTGFVESYSEKFEAEAAAKRVAGVVGLANDIEVRLPGSFERPDPDIARDAVSAIKTRLPLTAEHIRAVVKNGWITLEGQVEWNYQREAAENAVHRLRGVKGVTNLIQLQPRVAPSEIKRKIEEAFRRSAEIDASRVTVEAHDIARIGRILPIENKSATGMQPDGAPLRRSHPRPWTRRLRQDGVHRFWPWRTDAAKLVAPGATASALHSSA
jgi:osmotically-inducible protein OsmY